MSDKLLDIRHANCWAEIDLSALGHNVNALRSLGPDVMAVLKADAYGHGVEIVAPELARLGMQHFGVATASEGAALRELVGDLAAIYVMTACAPSDLELTVEHDLTPFLSSEESLACLAKLALKAGKRAHIHIEIDTGIGRAGVSPESFGKLLDSALQSDSISVTGICTHFTSGEDPADALGQYQLFKQCLDKIPAQTRSTVKIHAANSPALINVADAHFDIVRPGLLLYGIAPVAGTGPKLPNGTALRPVLTLKAKVILVRDLPAGTPISYGRTFVLEKPSRIATIGIGYGDGYSRRFSNIGSVILPSGKVAPIRGRVCMDQLCIEVPEGENLSTGDSVVMFGSVGATELRAADLAGMIDATPHEITTCITGRVPRVIA